MVFLFVSGKSGAISKPMDEPRIVLQNFLWNAQYAHWSHCPFLDSKSNEHLICIVAYDLIVSLMIVSAVNKTNFVQNLFMDVP